METISYILRIILTNSEILQLLALIIGGLFTWLLKRTLSWIGLKLRADRLAMLQQVIDKAMMLGVVKAEDTIREKGWDSLDARHSVINVAIPILEEKFRDTLSENGLDLSKPVDRLKVYEQMERMVPDLFARAAASPATPPAPVVPAVVVPGPNTGI